MRLYRSGLLDYGQRRVLVIAPARGATPLLPAGSARQGNVTQATQRVRAGGWLILSQALASEHHLHIGQALHAAIARPDELPPRGAIDQHRLGARSDRHERLRLRARLGQRGRKRIQRPARTRRLARPGRPARSKRALGGRGGQGSGNRRTCKQPHQHATQQTALSRQALARLTQIATLIPIVAVLAMAAAIGAMICQRRPRLAKLKLEGLPRAELWHTILLESLLLVGAGCLTGAIFGLYGQQLADRALAHTINFPVVYSVTALTALSSLALMTAAALAILAIPGYLAASVPAALALAD